jgi:hypothetical protein
MGSHPPTAEVRWPSRAALAEPATEPVIIYSNGKMPHEEGTWKNVRDTVAQSHQGSCNRCVHDKIWV